MTTKKGNPVRAGRYERSGERATYRNGYRDRSLETRLGSLHLRVPKLRQGSYFPPFLEPRRTSEKALVALMRQVRRRYLPSLGALATFEVAARHLSFTLAARELNVTQGAVSQQIRLLEKALEIELFMRRHNALELTQAGVALLGAVSAGLDTISDGMLMIS